MDRLVLVHGQYSLSAEVCRTGFRACEVVHAETVTWSGRGDLAASVSELRRLCRNAGHAGVWSGTAFVCLAPDTAMFHDRETPSTSASVVRKSVSVLLEADFPCDATELQHRITLVGRTRGKGTRSVSTSVRSDVLRAWHAALQQNGVTDCRITAAPWPILAGLPPLKEQALLLYVREGRCVAVALGSRGEPLRICPLGFQEPLPAGGEAAGDSGTGNASLSPETRRHSDEAAIAASIRRECALVFSGLDHHPRQLLLYGDAASGGLANRLGERFDLPVALPGRDLPLARHHARPGETDSDRLLAICLLTSSLRPLSSLRPPLFSARLQQRPLSGMRARFRPLVAGVVCLVASWMASVGIDGFGKLEQAERLEADMLRDLRAALPDRPRNASLMKLRTILRARAAEQGPAASASGRTVLDFLRLLHTRVPDDAGIHVGRLSYDAGIFRLVGTASKYEELAMLRDALLGQDGVANVQLVNAAYRETPGTASSGSRTDPQRGNVHFEMSVTWDR